MNEILKYESAARLIASKGHNTFTFGTITKKAPPAENAAKWELLLTSKVRHSSVGWNPVHRIFKHLEGLGPSLRWDDRVNRSSQIAERQWARRSSHKFSRSPTSARVSIVRCAHIGATRMPNPRC